MLTMRQSTLGYCCTRRVQMLRGQVRYIEDRLSQAR